MKRAAYFLIISLLAAHAHAQQNFGDVVKRAHTTESVFAITFDDGPGRDTPDILNILDKYNAKATFFLTAHQLRFYSKTARALTERGHTVGSHTTIHKDYRLQRLNGYMELTPEEQHEFLLKMKGALKQDLLYSEAEIYKAAGELPVFLRMPYGASYEYIKNTARDLGYIIINWSAVQDGPEEETLTDMKRLEYYKASIKPGAIILLHDLGDEKKIKRVKFILEGMLEEAQKKGFEAVTVDQMLCINLEEKRQEKLNLASYKKALAEYSKTAEVPSYTPFSIMRPQPEFDALSPVREELKEIFHEVTTDISHLCLGMNEEACSALNELPVTNITNK